MQAASDASTVRLLPLVCRIEHLTQPTCIPNQGVMLSIAGVADDAIQAACATATQATSQVELFVGTWLNGQTHKHTISVSPLGSHHCQLAGAGPACRLGPQNGSRTRLHSAGAVSVSGWLSLPRSPHTALNVSGLRSSSCATCPSAAPSTARSCPQQSNHWRRLWILSPFVFPRLLPCTPTPPAEPTVPPTRSGNSSSSRLGRRGII